jgi:hypothetical protein
MPKKNVKKNKTIGAKLNTPKTIEVEYVSGGFQVDSMGDAIAALTMMEEAANAIAPITDFISRTRAMATGYAKSHAVPVIQLEGRYWRKIQRKTRFFVGTPDQMPKPKPKGAVSLKEICAGKKTSDGKPLWNFITKRVPDKDKIDRAVALGYLTEKQLGKAYLESDQAPFLQRFEGEAMGEDVD